MRTAKSEAKVGSSSALCGRRRPALRVCARVAELRVRHGRLRRGIELHASLRGRLGEDLQRGHVGARQRGESVESLRTGVAEHLPQRLLAVAPRGRAAPCTGVELHAPSRARVDGHRVVAVRSNTAPRGMRGNAGEQGRHLVGIRRLPARPARRKRRERRIVVNSSTCSGGTPAARAARRRRADRRRAGGRGHRGSSRRRRRSGRARRRRRRRGRGTRRLRQGAGRSRRRRMLRARLRQWRTGPGLRAWFCYFLRPFAGEQLFRGVAQPGRAPGSGPGGRRFESCLPDQFGREFAGTFPRPAAAFSFRFGRFGLGGTARGAARCRRAGGRGRRSRSAAGSALQQHPRAPSTRLHSMMRAMV